MVKHNSMPMSSLSLPGALLRAEGAAVFLGVIVMYANQGFSGVAFVALLLVPDLAMVGYLLNPRIGSIAYNTAHFYGLPLALALIGLLTAAPLALQLGLIWLAHIGMDRTVGYGLKYPTDFKDTHLQRV